jgi:hypothetical protein
MPTPQSSFVIKQYDGFGGKFVDSDYLGAAYETGKPHMFEGTLMKIYSSRSRFFTGKSLIGMTGAKGSLGTKEIDTELYRWRLQGAEERTAMSIENVEASTTPGIGNTTFKIKLDIDYFAHPDVLFSEDNEWPLAIVNGPIADGTGFIYEVKIQTDSPAAYLDPALLEAGRQFNKVWTSIPSEYNQWFGTQQYPNSFMLENQVGFFGQAIHVTDKALRDQGRLEVEFMYTDYAGKSTKVSKFMPMAEAKMWDEFYRSMEVQLVYGKKSTSPGKDKYWVKTGPGMREQLKDAWNLPYNGVLTVNMIQDYLMSIFYAREDEQNRKVVAMTGTLGSILFHNALVAVANGFLTVDTHFIEKVSSPVETPHLAYGAQFTRYRGPEGVIVDLIKNPMYDSNMYCKRYHPLYPDMTVDSARMTFLDFGTSQGENNISMLKVKDSFSYGYTVGTVGPNGPVKGGQVGALKAGYDVYCQGSAGLWIKDVTRCGEVIYDFEA